MIVLDTHVVLWWTSTPELLSEAAAEAIDGAAQLGIAAISFWEISMLVRKRRIALRLPVAGWMQQVLAIPRVRSITLTPTLAVAADRLDMHPDPADRFIVATAAHHHAALVTKDALVQGLPFVDTIW
jgi:PIN domain nuclease of toxin-antitoxin system